MSSYMILKHTHMTTAVLSLCLFVLRGLWMMVDSAQLRRTWVRVLPHLVDTVLLASALGMLWLIQLNPFRAPWITAKIVALVVYIVLGMLALKRGRNLLIRSLCWVLALGTYGYIVGVAMSKNPWWVQPYLSGLV